MNAADLRTPARSAAFAKDHRIVQRRGESLDHWTDEP
jgi:hypothetical protein